MGSAPLRVMFLTPYFRPYLGGIERAIEELASGLMEDPSVEAVGVLTTKYAFPRVPHPEWSDRDTSPEGISIFRLKGNPQRSIPLYSVPLVWFSPRQVRQYLEEFRPNVLHFVGDGWFWGHFWTWAWYRRHARFVFTPSYHTLPVSRWWLRPLNGFICNVVDRTVSLTQQEARQVRRDYWAPPSKQAVIGWGASRFVDPVPAIPERDQDVTILCVGRLGHHKGQEWLLEVYQQARSQFQRPARLVLGGADEGGEASLRNRVQAGGLKGEVIFTGELDNGSLARWYARADLFALFSQYEAFGLVYFEALVTGTPVLTHDVGANRELLTHGAVVVPRFDCAAAVAELVRLVNDADYRHQLGRQGQDYARREFSWSAVARKYLEIYQS
jgi:glycosyltransferase involved in cell wall biosynthesis